MQISLDRNQNLWYNHPIQEIFGTVSETGKKKSCVLMLFPHFA